MATHSKLAIKG